MGNGEQHLNVGILARTGLPLIELAGRHHERLGQGVGDGMLLRIADHESRLWRPVVAVEGSAAQELVEPGPLGAPVVVGRGMEAYPSAPVLHIFLEGLTLRLTTRRSIQADDDAVLLQFLVGVFGQGGGDIHDPALTVGELVEELDGLLVELDMGLFGPRLVVQQGFEAWGTGIVGGILAVILGGKDCGEANSCSQQQEFLKMCLHIFSLLVMLVFREQGQELACRGEPHLLVASIVCRRPVGLVGIAP